MFVIYEKGLLDYIFRIGWKTVGIIRSYIDIILQAFCALNFKFGLNHNSRGVTSNKRTDVMHILACTVQQYAFELYMYE